MEVYHDSRGNGPRTAGNKSLVSYRAGHGITGYVGYIPSAEAIPIPVKEGPSMRAGPAANRERAQPRWSASDLDAFGCEPRTVYMNTIAQTSGSYGPTRKAVSVGASEEFLAGSETIRMDGRPQRPFFVAKSMYTSAFISPVTAVADSTASSAIRSKKPAYLQGTTVGLYHDCVRARLKGFVEFLCIALSL